MFPLLKSLRQKWHGVRCSLAFSNWLEILLVRAFHPRRRIVVYEWHSRFVVACDTRLLDHCSPKESLAEAAYDLYLRHSTRDGKCAYVNIGANIGAFDVAVAALAQVTRALSVEMNPRTYQRLCFNHQANDFDTVRTLNCGVAGEAGCHQALLTSCSLADSLWANTTTEQVMETVEVPLKTLAQCLTESGFDEGEFDLLKLDCEGAEYGIIRQSSPETLRHFRYIVMELHPCPPGEAAAALSEKLAATGFSPLRLEGSPAPAANLSFWERLNTQAP